MAYVDRHTIIQAGRQRELFNWIQCYDPASLGTELEAAGWEAEAFLGNLAGDPYEPETSDFAVIARTKV